ncbi:MAG: 16S rRNA (cytosine(967)-C(5))-methyltransferase RsmB [Verrucomicrobiota bacterium]|nr:16S rRNA (cytosine(967)-C(5))-methyltransferase RsmB [Verrucomicrobiota bacterium]
MLEWAARRSADREPDPAVWPFLLVGLYQVFVMDQVAHHAAVHETVEAVKHSRVASAAGFVNGILRRTLREIDAARQELRDQPLAVRESHPDFLVGRWRRCFGEASAEALCRWNNGRPAMILRPNRLLTDAPTYLARLLEAGLKAEPHPFAPDEFITLRQGARIPDLPGYADGLFSVQDPSTRESIRLLDPRSGQRVLDACAAPGGKTIILAERMRGKGRIVAMDRHADRLQPLQDNVARLRLGPVEVLQGDASSADDMNRRFPAGSFDRILLDVPCANTGVLRRRPDAKWRFSPERLTELAKTQRAMLDATAPILRPGGLMVYSVCSLEPEEGENQVAGWLRSHPGFEAGATVSLFPPDSGTDGIFAAAIARSSAHGRGL